MRDDLAPVGAGVASGSVATWRSPEAAVPAPNRWKQSGELLVVVGAASWSSSSATSRYRRRGKLDIFAVRVLPAEGSVNFRRYVLLSSVIGRHSSAAACRARAIQKQMDDLTLCSKWWSECLDCGSSSSSWDQSLEATDSGSICLGFLVSNV